MKHSGISLHTRHGIKHCGGGTMGAALKTVESLPSTQGLSSPIGEPRCSLSRHEAPAVRHRSARSGAWWMGQSRGTIPQLGWRSELPPVHSPNTSCHGLQYAADVCQVGGLFDRQCCLRCLTWCRCMLQTLMHIETGAVEVGVVVGDSPALHPAMWLARLLSKRDAEQKMAASCQPS